MLPKLQFSEFFGQSKDKMAGRGSTDIPPPSPSLPPTPPPPLKGLVHSLLALCIVSGAWGIAAVEKQMSQMF